MKGDINYICGFVGFCNRRESLSNASDILRTMESKLSPKCIAETFSYERDAIHFGYKSEKEEQQIMAHSYDGNTYTILYSGQLYNREELKETLSQKGFSFNSNDDCEVLLKAFFVFSYEIVNYLNGMFSFVIWNEKEQELFVARDHFGIKPFYYTLVENAFVFSSEVKALFEYPNVKAKINQEGICELFGLGPAHTSGKSAFKDICELKPAHFGIFNRNGFLTKQYWKLESKPHTDSLEKTCETIEFLIQDSIEKQIVSQDPLCTFLSGGLDSSIITTYVSHYYKKHHLGPLHTYSVDYVDNDKNFVKTDFQPNSDQYYIELMKRKLNTVHHTIMLDTPELANNLEDAMLARDFPGMADVDSSLLLFCSKVKPNASVTLTGECADEIFGGYPWFFREDALNSNTFPWSIALSERQQLLSPPISQKINLKEYIDSCYQDSLKNISILSTDSKDTAEKRKISYLTLNWFMQTLLDRSERMANYNGFEIRVPFCDYRLAQYVWNIPWEMKALDGREKGLLRYVMKKHLPEEIIDRKKSPYPKTWNPTYLNQVKGLLSSIIEKKDSPIHLLLNKKYIEEIIKTDGSAFTRPWFGQLMTGPQLMAYLVQVNMWLETYQPEIEL